MFGSLGARWADWADQEVLAAGASSMWERLRYEAATGQKHLLVIFFDQHVRMSVGMGALILIT